MAAAPTTIIRPPSTRNQYQFRRRWSASCPGPGVMSFENGSSTAWSPGVAGAGRPPVSLLLGVGLPDGELDLVFEGHPLAHVGHGVADVLPRLHPEGRLAEGVHRQQ